MSVTFKGPTKHGPHTFFPAVPVAFEDDGAEAYFIAAGFAEPSKDKPVAIYPVGSIEIDPDTIHAETGARVLEG